MLYTILITVLMLFCMVNMLRSISTESSLLRLAAIAAIPATAALAFPWMVTVAGAMNSNPQAETQSQAMKIMYGGCISSLVLAGLYLFRGVKEKGRHSFINA